MSDSQSYGGYNYLFGEADEITRRNEEYRRQHGINDDSPPLVSPEYYLSENISPTMNYYQRRSQPTMSTPYNSVTAAEYHYSQDSSQMIYHQHFLYQPIIRRSFCWRCLIWILISWPMRFFVPRNWSRPIHCRPLPFNTPPPSVSEHFGDRPNLNQDSVDEIIQRSEVDEREGLTERQISQLPTIKFKPSIEDKKCMICQSDYAHGEKMTILPCTHKYHQDCIRQWLQDSKLCCVCQREVVV